MAELTPAQQNLLSFLDKLASSPYSPALIQEGNEALDAAVEEHRQRSSAPIHQSSTGEPSHGSIAPQPVTVARHGWPVVPIVVPVVVRVVAIARRA